MQDLLNEILNEVRALRAEIKAARFKPAQKYVLGGMPIDEWLKKNNPEICASTFRKRIRMGWDIARAAKTPRMQEPTNKKNLAAENLGEACENLGTLGENLKETPATLGTLNERETAATLGTLSETAPTLQKTPANAENIDTAQDLAAWKEQLKADLKAAKNCKK